VQLQDGKTTVSGSVSSVQLTEGTPKLVVNGKQYDLSDVLSIAPAPAN
jgi:hypothetical protein